MPHPPPYMLRHLLPTHNSTAVRNVVLSVSPSVAIMPPSDCVKERDTNFICLFKKHSGHYMYHLFNIYQFYVLPKLWIYVLCVDLRTNSHYFPIQH